MFNRIAHIVLALFLLVSTSGVTFSMHYCGGKLVSTSINKIQKPCCEGFGGCCENKTLHFEVKNDFVSPVLVQYKAPLELDVLFPILFVLNSEQLLIEDIATIAYYNSSPPPKLQTRLSLLQTYRC